MKISEAPGGMGKINRPQIVVLGGGPGGLCAAWNLAKDGFPVVVLEKETVCGGQSITFQKGAFRYDLGSHNIHPHRQSIVDFLRTNLGDEFIKHQFSAQIFFRGRRVNYPFVGVDILKSMDVLTAAACGLSFLYARLRASFVSVFTKDDGTFKTWVINRFGRRFFDIFFGPYTRKVWGIPADQLSDVVAKKRIVVSGIIELIQSIIYKRQQYHPENPYTVENYYPRSGVGAISEFFVEGIKSAGGRIETGATVTKLFNSAGRIQGVAYSQNGKTERIEFQPEPGGIVLSTIPLNELTLAIEGDVPEDVRSAARGLDFTSEIFLYLNINKPDVFNVPLLYFGESKFLFNRIYDVGIFSRAMVPANKNAVCLDISCNQDEDLWNSSDDIIFDKCITPLEKHGLLRRSDVESYHTRRMTHAYPRFRVGYQEKLDTIFDHLHKIPNLTTFGRQGLFSYANVDDVIWMGFEVAKNVYYGDRLPLSTKELLPQYMPYY